jgi:hypothetical protein
MDNPKVKKVSGVMKVPAKVPAQEKKPEAPKPPAIQMFEFTINQMLNDPSNVIQIHEAVGFLELKLIELKEVWRSRISQSIHQQQELMAQSQNETKN